MFHLRIVIPWRRLYHDGRFLSLSLFFDYVNLRALKKNLYNGLHQMIYCYEPDVLSYMFYI